MWNPSCTSYVFHIYVHIKISIETIFFTFRVFDFKGFYENFFKETGEKCQQSRLFAMHWRIFYIAILITTDWGFLVKFFINHFILFKIVWFWTGSPNNKCSICQRQWEVHTSQENYARMKPQTIRLKGLNFSQGHYHYVIWSRN